jgi:hypothetical protein
MSAELAHALELLGPAASPVSSGVRISIPPVFDVSPVAPGIVTPSTRSTPPAASSVLSARPDDAVDVAVQVAALRPKRWPFVVALLAMVAAVAALFFETGEARRDAAPSHEAPAAPLQSPAESAVDRSLSRSIGMTAVATIWPPAIAAPAMPSSKATFATTPSAAVPSSRPQPPARHGTSRPDTNSSPAGTSTGSTVGYGYLE